MDSGRAEQRGACWYYIFWTSFVGVEGECCWARWLAGVRRRIEWREGLWFSSSRESDSLSSLSQHTDVDPDILKTLHTVWWPGPDTSAADIGLVVHWLRKGYRGCAMAGIFLLSMVFGVLVGCLITSVKHGSTPKGLCPNWFCGVGLGMVLWQVRRFRWIDRVKLCCLQFLQKRKCRLVWWYMSWSGCWHLHWLMMREC